MDDFTKTRISKETFLKQYAHESGLSVDELLEKRVPLECDCGDPICEGWIMIQKEFLHDFSPGGCSYASRFPEAQG